MDEYLKYLDTDEMSRVNVGVVRNIKDRQFYLLV